MDESAGKEIANLYTRGVNQGYEGQPLQAQYLLDLLDVFGEVGVRMYLVGILEGEEDAEEDEAATAPDAVEVIVDHETGEVTHIERPDADAPLDDSEIEAELRAKEGQHHSSAGPLLTDNSHIYSPPLHFVVRDLQNSWARRTYQPCEWVFVQPSCTRDFEKTSSRNLGE